MVIHYFSHFFYLNDQSLFIAMCVVIYYSKVKLIAAIVIEDRLAVYPFTTLITVINHIF